MLKTKIKASAVTNLTDARYFAAREVEWLGFRFSGGPESSISLMAAKAIAEWVDGVKIVGEFDFATAAEIEDANNLVHFDAVQLGMFTPADTLKKLPSLTFIKEVVVENITTEDDIMAHFQEFDEYCAYFLLDFTKAGIGWAKLQLGGNLSLGFLNHLFEQYKIILSLDFRPNETLQVLETIQPEALSLSGGQEEKVGLKSFEELDEMLDQLEIGG
ncbi:MAG: hypothetical protein IPM82_04875 [Saprospiraceae bacterium]|nr:hypothetical protein [Saprospiraceae bacterium]